MKQTDGVANIKAVFNLRKAVVKHQRYLKVSVTLLVVLTTVLVIMYQNAQDTRIKYAVKNQELIQKEQELETQKTELETEKETIEMVAKNNQELIEQNIQLQESLKLAALAGVKPDNYNITAIIEAPDYSKLKYVGEFEGTAYTPSEEECSNTLGYTASGEPIIPGVTVAVDTDYWKLGTKFYIEGLGYVVAMDTGSAVKGEKRFDFAVFDKDFALRLGRRMWKVYLVEESDEINEVV